MFKLFKKTIAVLSAACLISGAFNTVHVETVLAASVSNNSISWNFKDNNFKYLSNISNNTTIENLTLLANATKNMSVVPETINIDSVDYTYALALRGTGSIKYRAVKFLVNGPCTIKAVIRSSGATQRQLVVANNSGKKLGTLNATTTGNLATYNYSGNKGYIYLYSNNSDVHLYKIQVDLKQGATNTPSNNTNNNNNNNNNNNSSNHSTPAISGNSVIVKGNASLVNAVKTAKSGTTIVVDGTVKSNTITVPSGVNIKGINNAVIDFSSTTGGNGKGLNLPSNGSTISDITIKNAADNGIFISGNNNTLKNVICCYNHDAGFQVSNGGANNYFYKCTSHHNADAKGENADGFAVKLHSGVGNTFEECVAEYNSDDGWDCYAAHGALKLINCRANYNGLCNGIRGDGNGFKMGGVDNKTPGQKAHLDPLNHYLEGCSAVGNYAAGFDRNNQSGIVTMKSCYADSNKGNNYNWPATGKPSALGYKVTFGKAIIDSCISKNGKNDISGAILRGNCSGF
ncbi:right-handed parallel beta-helix repeat-containing protein [Lachnobacterium bovis]|uniref:right-handed parallel beta-helix repeat-containing protein n=1 Tax=Lachnobacterium bovis TaxID=140626 RepID=UPI0003B48C2C|nr:right-handed parallel beta-helix repeat-containing protein [Lachnobacterium bovis]